MGSVLDFIECPNCKNEATSDFYYKTGEEYIFCSNCGYHYSASYKRNETGELVTKDGTNDHSFANLIMEVNESSSPYASFRVSIRGNIGYTCGSLSSEQEYNELKANILNDAEVNHASVSRFIDGEIKVETLVESTINENDFII
jgi:Zn ribbon nucleic-acid-binding protein